MLINARELKTIASPFVIPVGYETCLLPVKHVQLSVQTTNHRFTDQALKTSDLNKTEPLAEAFATVLMTPG
jgi:hypothetical protein